MKTIQGTFTQFEVGNGKLSKFITETGTTMSIEIKSITQEDGSGHRFLINYDHTEFGRGYIDFKTGVASITV